MRTSFDAALARVAQETGRLLEWDESELLALECAMRAAHRREQLQALFEAERAGKGRPTSLTNYSAEMRLLDKQVIDCVARINVGLGQDVKSPQHQRAARARNARRWHPSEGRPGRPRGAVTRV